MIFYATKLTIDRFKIAMPEDADGYVAEVIDLLKQKEGGDRILEWGAKIFYFDRRKCVQLVNFASKFTIFIVDIRNADVPRFPDYIEHYLKVLYQDDKEMLSAIEKMFCESPYFYFDKIVDKSMISTLNTTQLGFLDDGYRLCDFIKDGIMNTVKVNRKVNFDWLFRSKINGKFDYFHAGKEFRKLMLERYGEQK